MVRPVALHWRCLILERSLLAKRLHAGPAERTRGVGVEPHVDASDVEQVLARRQLPHRLPFLHDAQAHRALRPPTAAAAPAAAAVAAGRRLGPLFSAVHERRQRGDGGRAEPAAAEEERPGRHVDDGAAAAAAAAAAEALAEHDHEDGDGGGEEADAEEDERVVRAVPALVRRVRQRVGARRQRHGRRARSSKAS
ncbi:hypothetical protein DAI22_02g107900 [Oryza sativa Japonica Group]|nr:hypothetical protein DAI22_02g107900 [Oryza sativa Japonica Group]